jgi:hypothetical protein
MTSGFGCLVPMRRSSLANKWTNPCVIGGWSCGSPVWFIDRRQSSQNPPENIDADSGALTKHEFGAEPFSFIDLNGFIKTSVDAAIQQAVLRGNVDQLKFLLKNVSNYSKEQARRAVQQCKINKKKISEGTLDVKDAEKRLYDSLKRAEDASKGVTTPRSNTEKVAEFFRAISKLFSD